MTNLRFSPAAALRLLLTTITLLAVTSAASAQGLTPEQVVRLQAVGSVALSPDGQRVAYTLVQPRTFEENPGSAYSELYVVPFTGGTPTALVTQPETVSNVRWSPDGTRIGFVARRAGDERRQVYAVPAGGGEPTRLTSAPGNVGSFEWSPDGDAVAYTMPRLDPPGSEIRKAPGDDAIVVSEQGRFTRLWIQPLGGGEARAITPDSLNVVSFDFAPGGDVLAVQATRRLGADEEMLFRDLYRIATTGGDLVELAPTPGKLGDMAWSPDGRRLAYIGATAPNDPLAQSVFVVPAEGGAPRLLTPGYEGSATWVGWLDPEQLLFVASRSTRTVLARVPAAGGEVVRVAGGSAEVFTSASLDANATRFAVPASTAGHPEEVYAGALPGGAMRRVTTHNPWLAEVELGRQETVAWTGPEELSIEGVLVYPVGYEEGRRYPLAILPHGGPEGVSLDGWTTSPIYPAQVLAGSGYVVLMPNYRGSGGRGVAFSKGDHRDLGGREFDDVLAAIDSLAGAGVVDAERVGITGASYGGYFSAWAATRHSDRFQVAIPFAGLTHWMSFMLTTDIPIEMSQVHFDLSCTDNVGLCWDRSPVAHVEGAQTPTLIVHGLVDERVHPEQSIELYNALRLQGVPTELVLYPREPHGLRERAHQLDYMRRVVTWMDRYLKGE